MRIVVSAETARPLPQVWAWWTDYGREGETVAISHGMGPSKRRVLSSAKDHVVFEESLPLPFGKGGPTLAREDVRIFHDAHRLEVEGRGGPLPWRGTWTFEPTASGGTRVTREMTFDAKALEKLGSIGEKMVRPFLERDVRHHLRELEREA